MSHKLGACAMAVSPAKCDGGKPTKLDCKPLPGSNGAGLLFRPGSLEFGDCTAESLFWAAQHKQRAVSDRRIAVPHVLVHAGLLLRLLQSRASMASILLCTFCLASVATAAVLSSRRQQLWARIREPFLAAGHVLYMAEGSAMLASFAVVICQPVMAMWGAALLTSALPWLLLDPLLMPISFRHLRWVQPVSAAALLPTNALRCSLSLGQCAAAREQFGAASGMLGLLGRLASPVAAILDTAATNCPCMAVITYLQVFVGVVMLLRVQKERERRARLAFAEKMGWWELADQLAVIEKPLITQVAEVVFLASIMWPLCQQLATLLE